MKWNWEFQPKAEKDFVKIDKANRRRIAEKLDWLVDNFDSLFPISLAGEYKKFYKFRVGNWRIFYKLDWNKKLFEIAYIDWRDKAYKKK